MAAYAALNDREDCPICYEPMGAGTGRRCLRAWRCHRHGVCDRCDDVLLGANYTCPICRADRLFAVPTTLRGMFALVLGSFKRLLGDAALAVLGTTILILIVQDVYLCRGGTFTLHFADGNRVWDHNLSVSCTILSSLVELDPLAIVHVVSCVAYKFFWMTLLVTAGAIWIWAKAAFVVAYVFGLVTHETALGWSPFAQNATDVVR